MSTAGWHKRNRWWWLYKDAKRRARRDGEPFTLTSQDVKEIVTAGVCAYCGCHPQHAEGQGSRRRSPTLDRLMPRGGYTHRNTVLACHDCNRRKAESTPAELRRLADKIDYLARRLSALPRADSPQTQRRGHTGAKNGK